MDEFALINMNARLYDPKLGRMLSVDNFVSAPGSAMGYNRYTYALNNPISVIDPSGNEPFLLTAILIGAALGGASYTASAAFAPGGLQKNFQIGGFLGSVGIGAVSGAVSYGVGSIFGSTATGALTASSVFNESGRAVAHGLVGMGFSMVQGGDAWSGFASGLLGSAAGSAVQMAGFGFTKTLVGGGIFSMGVGAGTSYITGGDPWIGAALGGLSFYANHMLHPGGGDGEGDGKEVNWEKVKKGAVGVVGGVAGTVAGVAATTTVAGAPVGGVIIAGSIATTGFGLANIIGLYVVLCGQVLFCDLWAWKTAKRYSRSP